VPVSKRIVNRAITTFAVRNPMQVFVFAWHKATMTCFWRYIAVLFKVFLKRIIRSLPLLRNWLNGWWLLSRQCGLPILKTPDIVNHVFRLVNPLRAVSPVAFKPFPSVCRIERQASVVDRRLTQYLIVLIQLLPAQIDINPEVFSIREVLRDILKTFKLLEKKFKALDNVPNIAI
jgi:hypothetical protein